MSELREQAREYTAVMRALVWRYVSWRQRRAIEAPVTEDDINEIKTEVSTLRFDLFEVFRSNGFKVIGTAKRRELSLIQNL
jgi:transient-receptor-potential-like protein